MPGTDFKRILRIGALAGVAALTLAACGDSESNVEASNRTGILHVGNGSESRTLDPHMIDSVPEGVIAYSVFEPLVNMDTSTLEVEPGVAERWELSNDQRVITFHLRKNARWSNGDPLTAKDFEWSFLRGLNPAMASGFADQLFHIEGAREYFSGEISDAEQVGIEALDDHTLQITLLRPTAFFFQILAGFTVALPVHRPTIEAHGNPFERFTPWTRPENFVGNGPFVIEGWQMQRRVSVRKNPHYWDADNVALEGIEFYPVENESTEERMFRVGQLHMTEQVPLSKIPEYLKTGNPTYRQTPMMGTYFLLLNTISPPLDDKRVRQALALSIDRELLVSTVLQDSVIPSDTLTPPGVTNYGPQNPLAHDPERARSLLADAGYPEGDGWPGLEFIYNTSEANRKVLVALQRMWKDNLGIEVTLTNMEWAVFLDKLTNRDFAGSRLGWIGGYMDPTGFLDLTVTDSVNNYTAFSNPRYDELVQRLAPNEPDAATRLALLGEAEELLLEEAPLIPIYAYSRRRLVQTNVKGMPPNPLSYINFKHMSLAGEAKP